MKESVVLVQTNDSGWFLQKSRLAEKYDLISTSTTKEALEICQRSNVKVASIVLGSDIKDPIQTSQRLHGIDKSISVIILTKENNIEPMRRSISFTPLIGNSTSCLSESDIQRLESELLKAIDGTIKSRQAKIISEKLNTQLYGIANEKHKALSSSKEYLERLFDSAPIGIMTLSSEGIFLALNKSASEMFEITEQGCIGSNIKTLFPDLALIPDRVESITKKIKDEQRHFEVTITTVSGQDLTPGYLLLIVDTTNSKNYEKALEGAVKVRDEFLSIASHELKTPITSLKLQLQMSQRFINQSDAMGPIALTKMAKSTDIALAQVQRLIVLVEDLLDVSRIEQGKLNLNYSEVNLRVLVEEISERLSQNALSAKCELIFDVPETLTIISDLFRLDQVITNLMINAFKYAAGKPVFLKVKELKSSIQIIIKDSGMGIEESKRTVIFERFERGISHENISGLGLGLYITKSIVDAHRGTIAVESKLGKGTSFTVTLPKFPV